MLVLVSWLIAAAWPQGPVVSLLSSEGVRWFFGQFTNNLAHPVVVWLLLLSLGWGALRQGGLGGRLKSIFRQVRTPFTYRERFALIVVGIELLLMLVVVALLTCIPHAVLLDVTGGLRSGAFPASLVPMVAFAMVVTGVTYGSLCDRFHSVYDVVDSLASGIRATAPWWLVAVVAMEFVASCHFVFFSV